jgi:hypothetical protein
MAEATGLSAWDTDPHFIISTFPDYAAVGAAYRALVAAKTEVTPRIQALADDITAGASDWREQAHRSYDRVSEYIRYVAVFLGNGGYEPHDAISILTAATVIAKTTSFCSRRGRNFSKARHSGPRGDPDAGSPGRVRVPARFLDACQNRADRDACSPPASGFVHRRVSPTPVCCGEGRLTKRKPVVEPRRRERVKLPHTCRSQYPSGSAQLGGTQTLAWAAYEREWWEAYDRLADGTGLWRLAGGRTASVGSQKPLFQGPAWRR